MTPGHLPESRKPATRRSTVIPTAVQGHLLVALRVLHPSSSKDDSIKGFPILLSTLKIRPPGPVKHNARILEPCLIVQRERLHAKRFVSISSHSDGTFNNIFVTY